MPLTAHDRRALVHRELATTRIHALAVFRRGWDGSVVDIYDWMDSLDDHVGTTAELDAARDYLEDLIARMKRGDQ